MALQLRALGGWPHKAAAYHRAARDQPGLLNTFKCCETAGRLTGKPSANGCDRPRRARDALENQPPCRIGERGQGCSVSHILR